MSKDSPSIPLVQRKASQSLPNENELESPHNQIPLSPSRAPLNSIPDPYQCQSKGHQRQFQHDSKEKPESSKPLASKKPETITETQIISSIIKTPRVYNRGKLANSEPNSAQSTPQIRSGPRFSNIGSASSGGCTIARLPCQFGNIGGRGGIFPTVSRGISVALPEQLLADVPHFELDEDRRFWEDRNVQVLIRIRPLNNNEMVLQGYGRCLRQESAQTVVWLGHPETRFTFDHIACESISQSTCPVGYDFTCGDLSFVQEKLFRVAGLPMVDNCMSGYNSCMFAYGQTGSGKTYTMMGETEKMDGKLRDGCGITPRIFEYLFTKITKEEESRKHERLAYSCKCSFLEIYNEQITDLLEPLSTNLQLREDSKKGVYVENLTEYSVRTVHDVLKLLQQGAANRKISATHMNSESSRSHSVFTCIIESRWEKDSMAHLRFGRLNLVDLAGSERQKSSGAEGDRLKEAANINKSLSTLGMVIMSLVDLAHGKHRHVPYRDSRLTFLLQDSLGGNSKTTIIANVSPSTCSASETLSTLKFAQRAKLIQNNAKINEDASGDVIALQHQIQQLKGQLSFLMKHQHDSMKLLAFAPSSEQSILGLSPERSESSEEINLCGVYKTSKGGIRKMEYFEATLHGALRREKLIEMEVRKLKAEIEQMNCLAHQRQEEAQHSKIILRFREEKIQRLELLSDGLISADKFYRDENNALREEIQHLHEKIDRNPEVNRFALENSRLLEQIRLFQDFYEQGERETLLAEISMLRNQLLELLEVEKCYAHDQFLPMKRKQEPVEKELEQCKEMNSKLMREVDELQNQLGNSMNSNQDIFNSIETGVLRNNSIDEATVGNLQSDEVDCDKNDQHILNLNGDNVHKKLIDAQSLLETFKLEQLHLNEELESVQAVNQQLVKMLDNKEIMERKLEEKCKDYNREIAGCKNHDPNARIESNEGASIMALQAKLDELSGELKEAQMRNSQFIKDRATWLSQDHQTELVRNEVETETTKAIIYLQEEIDRLQIDFQGRLCSMAQQNLSLRNSVLDKEGELRIVCSDWERATLDLTTFLVDGSRSLDDASHQIKSISCSFPNISDWIGEHVERAAKICVEKEETILLLQKSLEDAQKTVMQMEHKLHSLKGATVALTEYQQLEKSSSGEEIQLSGMSDDLICVKEVPENKPMSKEGQITDNQTNALLVESVLSDYSMSTVRGNVDGNMSLSHKNAFATADVDMQIESAVQILLKTEDAFNDSCFDANTYLSELNSEIHNTVSMYKELVQGFIKDVSGLRKDIMELKRNRGSLQLFTGTIPSRAHLKHENQLQMLQQIRNELAGVNNRLSSMSACFHQVMNMHHCLDSSESLAERDGWTTDCSNSYSSSSLKSVDNDDKSSSSYHFICTSHRTEQILDSKSDEESDLSRNTAGLLFRMEFAKAYAAFVKLKDELMAVAFGETNQSCVAEVIAFSTPNALENCNKQHRSGRYQSTSQKIETGCKSLGQFGVEENGSSANFFTKIEEGYVTMKDADCMLKAMLKANENANIMTAMWKQSGEKLMADKENLSKEIKHLKSCILRRDGENEVLHDHIQFSFTEITNILSLLEEFFLQMQTGMEELFKASCSNAAQVVEEAQSFSCSSGSCLEDFLCKALQNDVSMFVLQCQIGEYFDKIKRMDRMLNISPFHEHSSIKSNLEMGHKSRDVNFAIHPVKCESEGNQIADDTVNKISELMSELERKEILLEGLLFDFSLLQELASQRKDIKDEIEKLVIASSKVQHELQIKTVQLDDVLVQNTKLESSIAEAELALFNSNSELDQAKQTLDSLFEQNVELKILLKDLYLKNSEVEQLLEEQKETIKSLEDEIICASSSPQKDSIPSMEDTEDALKRVTTERDQLLEKLCSLQDRLEIACAVADENQAIAAEAHQESEASKMYAEQKEEEVKILEHSVEELESTINVLEEKVHEMEEEVEKHRVIRDSLELELQALRHRLSTVEDFTESMSSENSNTALHEDKLLRKLHVKSLEINEARDQIRYLEAKNAEQAKEIKQFKGYISELVLHAEAQASQYQQKYKNLEAMVREVKTDLSNVSATSTLDRVDKISTRTRGSSSPFRCMANLVQQLNQEKDQELSNARLHIEELETLAASRHKEVCMLNTRLATAESMTHDVIRDLLSVKLDITNYANIIDQHQVQKLIQEAQHHQEEFAAMEQEIANLRSHIDDLLEERERCISEVNRSKADQLRSQIILEQLQERDQMLFAQNDMLKMDKCNLQKRLVELDEMVKKLLKVQESQPWNQQQMSRQSFESDLDKRLEHSQKVLSRINDEFAQYSKRPDAKLDSHGRETKFR